MNNVAATFALCSLDSSPASFREARIRAEVRGEADPTLHALMCEVLEDAAAILNSNAYLETAEWADPLDVAKALKQVAERAEEICTETVKKEEESAAALKSVEDELYLCDKQRKGALDRAEKAEARAEKAEKELEDLKAALRALSK